MTRMWLVPTNLLCRNHLLGEHKELHQLIGSINHNKSIKGYVDLNLVQTNKIISRHTELVEELQRRKYNHKSPLPNFNDPNLGFVDPDKNLKELCERCPECRKLILGEEK